MTVEYIVSRKSSRGLIQNADIQNTTDEPNLDLVLSTNEFTEYGYEASSSRRGWVSHYERKA